MEDVEPGGPATRIGPRPTFTIRVHPRAFLECDGCGQVVRDWGEPWNYPEHEVLVAAMEEHQCPVPV